jgi:hypothetical protein
MSDKKTCGSAFPTGTWEYDGQNNVLPYQEPGMTLRDYFAAKAMQGLMGRSWADLATGKFPENLHAVWATAAYQMADAMLKARET